jgi:hypothetical protein
MIRRFVLFVSLASAAFSVWAAPALPDGPRQIQLAPQATVEQVGAHRYRLLPDPRDVTRGNASPLWRLASDASHEVKHNWTDAEYDWAGAGRTSLKNLPRQQLRDLLAKYTASLRLARQAALRDHCDWEFPPTTFQSVQAYMPLSHVQSCRQLANLLCIQYRLQLAEGRFVDAAETLQTGFALAHHLGEGSSTLINLLVSIAIDAIMFGCVEEWIQTPGSPNLYWALTELPEVRANLRRAVGYELGTFDRSFPGLRRIRRETLTAAEADSLANEVFGWCARMVGMLGEKRKEADALEKGRAFMLQATKYPQARKRLLEWGRSAKELDAMPKSQVILLWYTEQWDRARDDLLKALTVPTWQGMPLMEAALKEHRSAEDPLLALLVPTIDKTWFATVRSERQLAGLRGAEALRLYAAAHGGKPPAKWSDITLVPLPIDPLSGKGLDVFYEVTEGRGILEIPPPPPFRQALLGRRYELEPR